MARRRDGVLYAVAGFSRSGKTAWVHTRTRAEKRLLVWDWPKLEWGTKLGCLRVSSFEQLRELVKLKASPARIAFARITEDPHADFEAWSRFAWGFVRNHGAPVIAEELSSVTTPGKAPAAWGNVCRMGLGYGSDIYAITQRPAESDKTSLGNASVIHAGLQGTLDDERTMAKYLRVPVEDVAALKQLEWIERDRRTGVNTRGRLKFSGK